jgi:hypothetical protein
MFKVKPKMVDKKINRKLRELKSLRYRAHARFYDRKVIERRNRLRKSIRQLRKQSPESATP